MKNIITLLVISIFVSTFGQNPSKFREGINLPNATELTTTNRIPIIGSNGDIKHWISVTNLFSPITTLLNDKVDKESGKSLILDSEITRLATVTNQDVSGIVVNADAIDVLEAEQITQNDAIALNTDKVGITSGQASAITANTNKTGITSGEQNKLANIEEFAQVNGTIDAIPTNGSNNAVSSNGTFDALATKINNSEKGANNGVATLGSDGKVPNDQIPALAISETFEVSSQAQMLALSQAEQGDVAVRSDVSQAFILKQTPVSTLANWVQLLTPASTVTSVAGRVGVVVLNKDDVGLANADNTSDVNKPISSATQTALNGKLNLSGGNMTGSLEFFNAVSRFRLTDGTLVLLQGLERSAFGGTSNDGIAFVYGNNSYHIATNSLRRLIVNGAGDVGIGTASPAEKLDVNGNVKATNFIGNGSQLTAVNSTSLGGVVAANYMRKDIDQTSTGTITANNFILSSDRRLKTKIRNLQPNHIPVNWKSFRLKTDKKEYRVGVIAQELEKTNPEFVNTDDKGMKSVKYLDLMMAKIAELESTLIELQKEIKELKSKN